MCIYTHTNTLSLTQIHSHTDIQTDGNTLTYTNTHTFTHKHTLTDNETNTDKDIPLKHTYIQRDRHTDTHTYLTKIIFLISDIFTKEWAGSFLPNLHHLHVLYSPM